MEKKKKFAGLTGAHLKWIAVVTMFLCHAAIVLVAQGAVAQILAEVAQEYPKDYLEHLPAEYDTWKIIYDISQYVSRIAFPIYCFLLVEGFKHTRSIKKYVLRLGLFALISEVPFDLAFNHTILEFSSQNVFFTLFIGAMVMWGIKHFKEVKPENDIIPFALAFAGMVVAFELNTDYADTGVLLIAILYAFRDSRKKTCIAGALTSLLFAMYPYGITTPLAFIPIWFYNGERGKQWPKYFFYIFYPAHLLLLAGLKLLLF